MKMAKASEADLNMAMRLVNYLDAIERWNMPDDLSVNSELTEWIDTSSKEQYARLMDGLRRLLNRGSISRVIFGMAVICDPANKCIDPNADTIEHHPDVAAATEQRDELLAALKYLQHHELWINSHAKAVIQSAITKVGAGETAEVAS